MSFRNNLQIYIDDTNHSLIVYRDEHCVVIRDKFPKSMCHLLVLPLDEEITHLHPLIALRDEVLRRNLEKGIEAAKHLAVETFVQEGYIADDTVSRSDFKKTFVKVGVHYIPSMANLHIHVLTKDMYLPCMKNKKHYNSFNTDFFVEFLKFENQQLSDSDDSSSMSDLDSEMHNQSSFGALILNNGVSSKRLKIVQEDGTFSQDQAGKSAANSKPERLRNDNYYSNQLKSPLRCTHCGKIYGNKFVQLKDHLRGEFVGYFKRLSREDR